MITGIIEQKHSSHFIESNTLTIKVYTVYIYYYHVTSMSKACSCSMWMGTIKPGGHPRRPVQWAGQHRASQECQSRV